MNRTGTLTFTLAGVLTLASAAWGQEAAHLCDFEDPADIRAWEFTAGTPGVVEEGVTHGRKALEITFDPQGQYHPAYMTWRSVRGDWSGFDALVLDVFNPGLEPIPATVLIADRAWVQKGRSYWNRHNGSATLAPGPTRWTIPVGGLYRGEAGSRNNDIKRNIDASEIVRLDFGFGVKGAAGRVIVDDLRLVRVARPAGVWAFDFGPPDQSVMPGWTAISNATAYTKQRGFGWGPQGGTPWNGAARDTTFGPALLRDFCEAGGYRFRVDAPAGRYRVTVVYENSGYWGGEQAMQSKRRILAGGEEAWSETRPDGSAHALYRFEEIEPLGVDIWDTYMKAELAKPVAFDARAGADGLTLQFEADRPWGSKISALAVHRTDDPDAARWLAGQMDEVAAEFRGMAVCLDKPPGPFVLPPAWRASGLVAWPVDIADEVTPASLPPEAAKGPEDLVLSRLAARGEIATFCLAVRPDENRRGQVSFAWTKQPSLPAEVSAVWYNAVRGFNSIAYRLRAHTLRPVDGSLPLQRDVTRMLVLKVRVPPDAAPGNYEGAIRLRSGKGPAVSVPVRLTVSSVVLDRQTEFRMGFFGLQPPGLLPAPRRQQALERTLALLGEYGMNMVCGGPSWRLKGWKDGQPVIDFGEMDAFFALLRKHGFTGPINGY
ncbi:MAG TPA: hypothetical protein VFJ30_16325, partial [Phycisphaerae bacterium]|nr:hypothetical protein [Phycisphaerae bacterium]